MRLREVKEFFVGDRVKYLDVSRQVSVSYASYTIGTVSKVGEKIEVQWDSGAIYPLYNASQLVLVENEFDDEESLTEDQLFEIDSASQKLARECFYSQYSETQLGEATEELRTTTQAQLRFAIQNYIGTGKTTDLITDICHLLDTFDANVISPESSPIICVAVTSFQGVKYIVNEIINHVGRDTVRWNSVNLLIIKGWAIQFVAVTNVQTFRIEGANIVALFVTHEVIDAMMVEFTEDVLGQFKLPKKMDTICDLIGNIRARMCVTRKRMEALNE